MYAFCLQNGIYNDIVLTRLRYSRNLNLLTLCLLSYIYIYHTFYNITPRKMFFLNFFYNISVYAMSCVIYYYQ